MLFTHLAMPTTIMLLDFQPVWVQESGGNFEAVFSFAHDFLDPTGNSVLEPGTGTHQRRKAIEKVPLSIASPSSPSIGENHHREDCSRLN